MTARGSLGPAPRIFQDVTNRSFGACRMAVRNPR